MADRKTRRAALEGLASLLLLLVAASALSRPNSSPKLDSLVSVLGPRDPRLVRAVSSALVEARRRLEDPRCRQVFGDFLDASGNLLAKNLEAAGQTGQSYLHWLIFVNGANRSLCERGAVALATDPGSRVITVCLARFLETESSRPGYAAALLIHEELHSLGLAENPPSSAEITARVISRCGT